MRLQRSDSQEQLNFGMALRGNRGSLSTMPRSKRATSGELGNIAAKCDGTDDVRASAPDSRREVAAASLDYPFAVLAKRARRRPRPESGVDAVEGARRSRATRSAQAAWAISATALPRFAMFAIGGVSHGAAHSMHAVGPGARGRWFSSSVESSDAADMGVVADLSCRFDLPRRRAICSALSPLSVACPPSLHEARSKYHRLGGD